MIFQHLRMKTLIKNDPRRQSHFPLFRAISLSHIAIVGGSVASVCLSFLPEPIRVVSAFWCVCVSRRVWARARKRASLETKRGSVGMDVRVFSWTMRVCGDGVYC
jgi:hypothetical protein